MVGSSSRVNPQPVELPCQCYKCTEPIREWDEHGEVVMNNLHGELRPCENCGRAKTEHVDRYTWGYYECWWCNQRAAGPEAIA